MTQEQVAVVQQSFAKVAPVADRAAVMFYERLFEGAPQVKAMFPADMTDQHRKLTATLGVVVNGLLNLETVLPAVSASPSVIPLTAQCQSITRPWDPTCCGHWRGGSAMPGRRKSPMPGPQRTARFAAT